MKKEYIAPVSKVVKITLTLLDSTSPGIPKAIIDPNDTVDAEEMESRRSFSIWGADEE